MKFEENVRLMLRANVVARRSRSREATAQQVRTKHACTAHATSIDKAGLIIKSKATSALPRVMNNASSTYNISFMYSLPSLCKNTQEYHVLLRFRAIRRLVFFVYFFL